MAIHGERADWAYDGAWADGLESQLEENRTAVSNQANPLEDLDPYGLAYVIWELVNEDAHASVSRLGLEKFYKRWNRCFITMPKIILGENIV